MSKYIIRSNEDETMFVKSLCPFQLGSEFEAVRIDYESLINIFHLYGLEEDYTAIELDY